MAEDDLEVRKNTLGRFGLNMKKYSFHPQLECNFFLGFTFVNATITIVTDSFKIVLMCGPSFTDHRRDYLLDQL